MDERIKHLEMIQVILNRMAQNAFLIKGWSVLLVSALFALSAKDLNIFFIYLAYFPAIAFCVLDGYFLHQEKLYRNLYDKVRQENDSHIDFSMDTTGLAKAGESWLSCIFSKTILIFHGSIIAIIVIVMLASIVI